MLTNIKGLVDRLNLRPAKAMTPLFEAISNAIDAIEEHGDNLLVHSIHICLVPQNDLVRQSGDTTFVIDGFDVVDNGVGFNNANLASFREAYTLAKVKLGGKGVGRFTYLKVFSTVHIRSTFRHQDQTLLREFSFSVVGESTDADEVKPTTESSGTKISVRGIYPEYINGWPQDPNIIAERIIAHFLIRFAGRSCPKIILESPNYASIDLQQLFDTTVLPHISEQFFNVAEHTFALQVFRHRDGRSNHIVRLCANSREVSTSKLRDLLPELPERFIDSTNQESYTLIVLVTGEYIDNHANQERTHITFQSEHEADIDSSLISRHALNQGIAETLRPLLADELKSTHQEKRAQIEKFVEQAPEYRALTHSRYKELIEQHVQPGLSPEKLDEALLHVKRRIEDSVRKEVSHIAARFEIETFEQYQEQLQLVTEKTNELGKAELAKYITHRRTILDLVSKSMKKVRTDGKYPLEKVLHNMIFPMGATSKEIFFEQQNLWIIDERLCFHTLLTSDKRLNSIQGLKNTSRKEPDIFAFFYDTPIGVAEQDNLLSGGIIIIEFKRPGKDKYEKDPADQIIQRFREISQSNVTDIEGRPINSRNLRFTGYLIADLTPALRNQVYGRYHQTADNEGYFFNLADGNGFIEIISYDKLINDAERRNRILFDILGLHKS